MAEPPSKSELGLVQIFRKKVEDLKLSKEQKEDVQLLRWLRARDLDLSKAETMLRESTKWRKDNDIDNLLKWKPNDFLLKSYPYEITGFTKDGCPVVFFQSGRWDVKKAIDMGLKEDYIKYNLQVFELYCQEMKHPVTQAIFVFDFEHYSYKQVSYGVLSATTEFARVFEKNYPETMKQAIIIKAPSLFAIFFNVIKPFLSEQTSKKIVVYDSKVENWKPALNKLLPKELIPPIYGGTCSKTVINQCGERGANIQKVFLQDGYISPTSNEVEVETEEKEILDLTTKTVKFEDFESKETQIAKIPAGCKHMVEIQVDGDFAILNWNFKTEFYDIGFSVITEEKVTVVPYSRVNSNDKMINGSYICDKSGKYVLCFDNSYSFMREKIVHYSVKID